MPTISKKVRVYKCSPGIFRWPYHTDLATSIYGCKQSQMRHNQNKKYIFLAVPISRLKAQTPKTCGTSVVTVKCPRFWTFILL